MNKYQAILASKTEWHRWL